MFNINGTDSESLLELSSSWEEENVAAELLNFQDKWPAKLSVQNNDGWPCPWIMADGRLL